MTQVKSYFINHSFYVN